jgi:hypothetical protein
MAKPQASIMVRGLDLGSAFLSALTKRARECEIPDEVLYEALKPEGPVIKVITDFLAPDAEWVTHSTDSPSEFVRIAGRIRRYEAKETNPVEKRRLGQDVLVYLCSAVHGFCERHRKDGFSIGITGSEKDFKLKAGWVPKEVKSDELVSQ